jgi:hypothetical protein
MIFEILCFPVTGVAWIGKQIQERAVAELDDKENLHKRLLALQLAFDIGDIEEEDFEAQEEELLLAISEMEELEELEAQEA